MKYIEAQNRVKLGKNDMDFTYKSTFLAGSITGAWNWQERATEVLIPHFNVFNPRRSNYSTFDPAVEKEQITWEHDHLLFCENILFYFSHETLAPITLFEYGKMLAISQWAQLNIFTCIHPEYKRKNDVLIQTELMDNSKVRSISLDFEQILEDIINFRS